MPKQTIGPEAKLIQSFDQLSEEGQRIVRDIINAKQPAPKPQEARAPRVSKKGLPPTAENGSKPAKEPMCGVCHQPKDHDDHRVGEYLSAHEFEPPKSGKRAKQKPAVEGENTSALAAGAE
jgi:hypothetical protein